MNPLTTPLFVKDLLEHDIKLVYLVFGTTQQATAECKLVLVNVDVDEGLEVACKVGNRDIANWMVEVGATRLDWALGWACRSGHRDLAEWSVENGATNWDRALEWACWGGHRDLAEWLVEKGANAWDYALCWACWGGHREICEWLLEKGAVWCRVCNGAQHGLPPR